MERLLLDTHAFLWWLGDDARLGEGARKRIAEPANPVFVSAATGWEIGIKRALGKLQAPDDLDTLVEEEGFAHLPITFFHGEQAGALPPHHRDPWGGPGPGGRTVGNHTGPADQGLRNPHRERRGLS